MRFPEGQVPSIEPCLGEDDVDAFLACGALHTALLLGLTGLHLNGGAPQGWAKHPVLLPEGWDAIEVERLWARGEPMRLAARHGADHARIEASHD